MIVPTRKTVRVLVSVLVAVSVVTAGIVAYFELVELLFGVTP